jgi:CrcB protein
LRILLFIGLAGALGAVSRYVLSGWTYRVIGDQFPYGTLAVNILGCFLLGALQQIGEITDFLSQEARVVMAIGFLGALTTFSTFGYETFRLLEDGRMSAVLGNVAAQLFLGLLAVWAGMTLIRVLFGSA